MRKAVIARRYAKALCELVEDERLDQVAMEMRSLSELLSGSHELFNALNNDSLPVEKRSAILDAFLSKFAPDQVLFRFFHLLMRNRRISLIDEILNQYELFADQRLGRARGEVTAPIKLPEEDLDQLQKRLGKLLGVKVVLSQKPDSRLLGGFRIRLGELLLDATLDAELERMMTQIAAPEAPTDTGSGSEQLSE